MVHEAGPMIDFVQRCARCGYVLTDYRNSMVPDGSPPLRGWTQGASVEVIEGNPRFSAVSDQYPNC